MRRVRAPRGILVLAALLRAQLRRYPGPVTAVVLLQAAQVMAALYLPTLNADLIDNGVITGDAGYILRTGGLMLAVTLLQIGCLTGAVYFGARTAMRVGRDLRAGLVARVNTFSAREVARYGASSLITRTTNDVQQVQTLVLLTFTLLVPAPIVCLGGVLLAVRQDAALSWLLFATAALLIVVAALVIWRMRPALRSMQEQTDTANRVLREQIMGIRVIRAFVRDAAEQKRFAVANTGLRRAGLGAGRLMALLSPAILVVINLSSVAVLWFGGHRVADGMQIGALTAFLSYLMQILIAVMMATFMFAMVPRAEVCAERIQEVLDTESSLTSPARPVTKMASRGRLELRDVDFRYPGAQDPVLHGVCMLAEPGQTTAIVGSTGAGKTTLLALIPRLTDPTGGQVSVNGVDVRDLAPDLLAATVGLVPQRPYLFRGTVGQNLRYGNPAATDEQLWQALEVAQARGFVEAMPAGLGTPVGQGGGTISGGQRQRLAIARMLLARPEICLFDDSFSALDHVTEAALRAALARELADATVLVVAQRVASVRDANRIVVLDQGRIAGTGTHGELMADNQIYREIVMSQLTDTEQAA